MPESMRSCGVLMDLAERMTPVLRIEFWSEAEEITTPVSTFEPSGRVEMRMRLTIVEFITSMPLRGYAALAITPVLECGLRQLRRGREASAVCVNYLINAETCPRSFEKFSSSVVASGGTNRGSVNSPIIPVTLRNPRERRGVAFYENGRGSQTSSSCHHRPFQPMRHSPSDPLVSKVLLSNQSSSQSGLKGHHAYYNLSPTHYHFLASPSVHFKPIKKVLQRSLILPS
ncbi:hypothetical protein BGZ57DRAFT_399487 [Hyaloscypha finlandica]|nr:hypothetical protein BGZ57DRAFT_399487 [Hyaloscypha finlandica]